MTSEQALNVTVPESLRASNRRRAVQRAIDATAQLVREVGDTSFTMPEVAERSGLSLRTLYRHFPTRQELVDALAQVANQTTERAALPRTVADIEPWLAQAWSNLLDDEALLRAQHIGPSGAAVRKARALGHRELTTSLVTAVRADLTGDELDDVVNAVLLLGSSTALFEFVDVLNVSVPRAAHIAATAIAALLER